MVGVVAAAQAERTSGARSTPSRRTGCIASWPLRGGLAISSTPTRSTSIFASEETSSNTTGVVVDIVVCHFFSVYFTNRWRSTFVKTGTASISTLAVCPTSILGVYWSTNHNLAAVFSVLRCSADPGISAWTKGIECWTWVSMRR